jgi:hypothetical protein
VFYPWHVHRAGVDEREPHVHITKVQQWVATAVLLIVGMGVAVPLAWASSQMLQDPETEASAVPLWVMSGVWGVATMAGARVIHGRSVLSPWLLVGLLPAAVVAPFVL